MDTLHFEPKSFYDRQGRLLFGDQRPRSIDDMNLSELEVFMLRGRRLQAQAMGGAFRATFATLRRWLHGSDRDSGSHHPDCHSHA